MSGSIEGVASQVFRGRNLRLDSGVTLPEFALAYETYGRMALDGRNVVLATHGYSSSHHLAGTYRAGGAPLGLNDSDVGSWDGLIGPGKPIDTDKLFVVSSNMLGSSYGSTSPRSVNPETGKRYGPDFPVLTVGDIVRAQKALLDHLGVKHLVAVAGGSFGGFQGFQWAVDYPDFMDGIVAAVTSPRGRGTEASVQALINDLATDPNWNGGWYYDKGGIPTVLTRLRVQTLKQYGISAQLAEEFPDEAAREVAIIKLAKPWVKAFDGHSLVVLRRAVVSFNVLPRLDRMKAKLLYAISRTDELFPPTLEAEMMPHFKAAGVDARYVLIDSDLGHLAAGRDAAKWADPLRSFMAELIKK
jgi:homoserine O-acetyltransferase/O-succinyltransferase